MKWRRGYESGNVEDRRGQGGGVGLGGSGLFTLLSLLPRMGLPGILLLVGFLVVAYVVGNSGLLGQGGGEREAATQQQGVDDPESFVGFVLDDVQNTWAQQFQAAGRTYTPAKLVLFTDTTPTACGYGQAATGPFYCPLDEKVYIDLSFYRELSQRFGAPGDFAQAYVIAHEVGHHVQNQLGILRGKEGVGTELQADCLAGVWAKSAAQRDLLDPGDVEEGMNAAAAVGDDHLQRMSGRAVNPETWTHGSSDQRAAAFRRGYAGGKLGACAAESLSTDYRAVRGRGAASAGA